MSDANTTFYGPISYSPIWLIIGLLFISVAVAITVIIFYITRKKEIKKIETLKISAPKIINMNVLRDKYIKMINEAEESFRKQQIKASETHQKFSLIVRLFFYEAKGFHADVMTLNDLKKTKQEQLTKIIDSFYPDEFNTLEKGSVADAAERARQIIREQQ